MNIHSNIGEYMGLYRDHYSPQPPPSPLSTPTLEAGELLYAKRFKVVLNRASSCGHRVLSIEITDCDWLLGISSFMT